MTDTGSNTTVLATSDFYHYARLAVEEELAEIDASTASRKKKLWEQMGKELEDQGYPGDRISRKIHETIEDELQKKTGYPIHITSGYFYKIMRTNNWVIPYRTAKNSETDDPTDPATAQEQSNQTSLIRDRRNMEFTALLQTTIDLSRDTITAFQEAPELTELYTKSQLTDYIKQHEAIHTIIRDGINRKLKIPQHAEHLFLSLHASEASLAKAAEKFLEVRLKLMKKTGKFLTRKQAVKFLHPATHNRQQAGLPIFQPHDRSTAIYIGYTGQPCATCHSYRTRLKDGSKHTCICADCSAEEPLRTIPQCPHCGNPLWDHLHPISMGSKCPECGEDISNIPGGR